MAPRGRVVATGRGPAGPTAEPLGSDPQFGLAGDYRDHAEEHDRDAEGLGPGDGVVEQHPTDRHADGREEGSGNRRCGSVCLNSDEVEELDKVELDIYDEPKTQSQRLRNVIFILWKQEGEKGDFKTFYKQKTEEIIQHFKNKLDTDS